MTPLNMLRDCKACELRDESSSVVLPVGHGSDVLFVGFSPSQTESNYGEALWGREGELFRKLLARSGFSRENATFTYLVKCHGEAKSNHILVCKSWLWAEIKMLRPKVIVALGEKTASVLLKRKVQLSNVAGQFFEMLYAMVVPWYAVSWIQSAKHVEKTLSFLGEVRAKLAE